MASSTSVQISSWFNQIDNKYVVAAAGVCGFAAVGALAYYLTSTPDYSEN